MLKAKYNALTKKRENTLYLLNDTGEVFLGTKQMGGGGDAGDSIDVMNPVPASPEAAGMIVKYVNPITQIFEGLNWRFGNYYKIGSKASETVEVDVFESGTSYMNEELQDGLIWLINTFAAPYLQLKTNIPDTEHILYENFEIGRIFTVSSLTDPVNEIKLYSQDIEGGSMTYNFTESYIIKNIEFAFDNETVFYIQDNYDNVHLVMPVSGNPFEQTVTLSNNEQIKCLLRCFDGPGQYAFYIQFVDIDDQHDVVSSLEFQVDDSGWEGTDSNIFTRDADYDFTQPLVVNIRINGEQEPYNLSWPERSPLQSDETHLYMRYYDIVEIEGELSDYTKCYLTGITFYVKDNQGYAYIADMYNGTASLNNTDGVQEEIIDMTLESLPENTQPVWSTLQVQYPYISGVSTDKQLFYIELGSGNVILYDLTDISYDVNTIQYNKRGDNVLILTSPTTLYWVTSDDEPVELEIENPDNAPVLFYGTNIFNSIDDIAALDDSDMQELFENMKNTLVIVKDTNIGYVLGTDTFTRVTLPYTVTDVLVAGGIYQFIVLDDNSAYCDIVYLQTHEEREIVNDPTVLYAIPAVNVTEPVPATADNEGRIISYIGQYTNQYGIEWINGNTYKIGSVTTNTVCIEHPMYITTYPIESGLDKGRQVIQYLGEDQTYDGVEWEKGGVYRIGTTKPEYHCEIELNEVMQQPISNIGDMLDYPMLYSMSDQIITYNEDDNELYAHMGELNTISVSDTIVDSGINSADFNSGCVWVENEDNEFSLVFDNAYTSLETKQFTINNVTYSIQITSIISGENNSGYNAWTRCKITDSNLKQSIAGFVINTGLYPIDSNLLDSELIIPSTSFKVQLQNGDQSDEIETTITPAIDVETGDPVINLVPMEITPVSGYKFIKTLSGLVLYNESTGVLYDIILERDVNLIAHPSSEYKVMILGGQLQAISNLLYMTNPLYSENENEAGNYLAVTSDNKIVEYTLDQNTNDYIEVHTYTDVDLSYTYTLINPVIIGYKPTGNDIVVYNREDYSVTYSQIPSSLKPNNVKIERSLEMLYANPDTNENVVAILGLKLQGIEDYFIYTSDGIHFFKFDVQSTAKILSTGYLNALSMIINESTLALDLISSITEGTTSEDPTVKLFQACEGSNFYTKAEVDIALNSKADTATTLAGYGITDANINNGVITLGSQTITPVQAVSGKGLSTNDYTTAEKNKLTGIAAGAEVNVQSDWNQTDTDADDFIKNKPDLTQYVTKDELESIELAIATALNNLNNRVTALENA